ncbi:MAG TPA: polysaccharide biosynthesis/export family protein [Terriglobia bacterium]|nr:polysaccharide biosynthesis/export family protein [Terriglobia bacterium]
MKSINSKAWSILSALVTLVYLVPGQVLAQSEAGKNSSAAIFGTSNASKSPDGGPGKNTESDTRIRIGQGDLLELSVFDVPELAQVVRVNDSGDASFSLIGRLHVAGLTADDARALIAGKFRDGHYVLNPQVSVLIREYSSQGVSVVGEVKRPGVYGVLGGQSLLDVLAAAGGATPLAGPDATVKRNSDGSTVTVHLTRDAQASLASDVRLFPGDKVIIPRAGLVYVLGDVARPGGFVMENDGKLTLMEALAMAGGNNRTASLGHARLLHKSSTGYTDVPFSLKKIIQGQEDAPQLQAEDILYIPSDAVKSMLSRTVPSIISSAGGAAIYRVP